MAITQAEIEAAAKAMMENMFAIHELPLSDALWQSYQETAKAALEAAEHARRNRMTENRMTLRERLENPAWVHDFVGEPRLAPDITQATMKEAAARIIELETVINRYLADDFSCNGGALRMFEAVMESKKPAPATIDPCADSGTQPED